MSHSRGRWIRLLALVHDVLWIAPSIVLAYAVRYNLVVDWTTLVQDLRYLVPAALVSHTLFFWLFGLYRGVWRFASIPDLVRILKAVAVGAAFAVFAAIALDRLHGVPRTVVVLYPVFLSLALAVPRLLYRWFKDHRLGLAAEGQARALIVGAGTAGELLVRDLLRGKHYLPVGLLDDDKSKRGSEIHGVRVLDRIKRLPEVAERTQADLVLLAMPGAPHRARQQVVALCAQAQLPCKTLPGVDELLDAGDLSTALRSVEIEDLLGRDPVVLDSAKLSEFLAGKRVLVTGAGGSIGSELCRQILRFEPAVLVALDHSEFNLYQIDREITAQKASGAPKGSWLPLLGDVRDRAHVEQLFQQHRPEVVFHAAAYKHVPLLESNEAQAVATNVFGTWGLLQTAIHHGSERFVLVSTDKAVNPTNVMGATKRVAELICRATQDSAPQSAPNGSDAPAAATNATQVIVTRFGNVLGSAGSVVPLFREQIAKGGPVTVTDPEMTRFFMTIPEAASLVVQAGAIGEGGQTYVLQMGEPVRIMDLARQMIRLAGLEPEVDIPIELTGLRPGEKMHEALFYPQETPVGTAHGKILRAAGESLEMAEIDACLAALQTALQQSDPAQAAKAIRQVLARLVPSLLGPASGPGEENNAPVKATVVPLVQAAGDS